MVHNIVHLYFILELGFTETADFTWCMLLTCLLSQMEFIMCL